LGWKDWQTILDVTEIFVVIFNVLFYNFCFPMYAQVKDVLNFIRSEKQPKESTENSQVT
jgi:hypothetical protein